MFLFCCCVIFNFIKEIIVTTCYLLDAILRAKKRGLGGRCAWEVAVFTRRAVYQRGKGQS